MLKWGLIPVWAKEAKCGNQCIRQLRKQNWVWRFSSDDRRDVAYFHDALSISGAAIDFRGVDTMGSTVGDIAGLGLGRNFVLAKTRDPEGAYWLFYQLAQVKDEEQKYDLPPI